MQFSPTECNADIFDVLTDAVKKDAKITYMELIQLGSEKDEYEMYLEKLLEDGRIIRRGKSGEQYWKIK